MNKKGRQEEKMVLDEKERKKERKIKKALTIKEKKQ